MKLEFNGYYFSLELMPEDQMEQHITEEFSKGNCSLTLQVKDGELQYQVNAISKQIKP